MDNSGIQPTKDTNNDQQALMDKKSVASEQNIAIISEISDELSRLLDPNESEISSYWRKNISISESTELANVLRALRKVAGHIGQNVGRLEWVGMSHNQQSAIVLDPALVMGRYPIIPQKFDYLVGIVTHEAIHKTEWSDLVWKKIDETTKQMGFSQKILFQKIVFIGEDIYIDQISEKFVFGLYTRISRNIAMKKASFKLKPDIISVDELVYLWWKSNWEDILDSVNFDEYRKPLKILNELTGKLKSVHQNGGTVTSRCEERFHLYCQTWDEIKDIISSWTVIDNSYSWYPPSEVQERELPKKKKSKKVALNQKTIQEIETKLAFDSKDLTPIIRSIVGEDDEDVIPISRWDFNIPSNPVVDFHMVGRLKAIFQSYADRKVLLNRGLTNGKVDKSKLYRAPINGRCFVEKQVIPQMDWNICLLIDASGSMRGNKWRMIENTLATLHKAFLGFQIRLQAYGYYEADKVCMVSSLIKDRELLSIPPSGMTASGEAIIAAAYLMPRDSRRRFLIHITDGESNFGCDVQYGIQYCRAQKIHLITLGCGYRDREVMKRQYGKTIQFLDHFGQLPSTLENLLKWTLLYGKDNFSLVASKTGEFIKTMK